ncbi:hypothetical protein ACLMJK_004925 [Lecanora helva]
MPRAARSSPQEANPQLSHAINLFLHKDRTSYFDDDSIASGSIAAYDPAPPLAEPSSFSWDLQYTCTPLVPAFQYISNKLQQHGLSVALIVSDQDPFVIPVWSLPKKSQIILTQIVRKAVKKFSLETNWLTTLASASNKCLPKIFDAYKPSSYLVRRSIVQHELIFSSDGLTLLTIDHIYTFKQLLSTLSRTDLVPQKRDLCLSSCVHLLRHINEIYTDPKVSSGYLARVYKEIDYQKELYKEVSAAYDVNYCTASIKDVTALEPNITALSDFGLDYELEVDDEPEHAPMHKSENGHNSEARLVAELPDSSPKELDSDHSLISPIAAVDRNTPEPSEKPSSEKSFEIISPLTTKHSNPQKPSEPPESPLDPDAPWTSAIPQPLNTRRASTMPLACSPPAHHQGPTPNAWLANLPSPRENTDSWPSDLPASLQTIQSRSSGEPPKSPFEYVRSWVESWSTAAPRVLCENCHEVATVQQQPLSPLFARRFTMA